MYASGTVFANIDTENTPNTDPENPTEEVDQKQKADSLGVGRSDIEESSEGDPTDLESNKQGESSGNVANSDFYEDDGTDSDNFISFNFLYYLLEKFKFTNALRY